MKVLLGILLLLLITSCRYKEPKASYSIIEEDTIRIENNVLESQNK